jgi:Beta-ketoacyl synthase, N-terminal domain
MIRGYIEGVGLCGPGLDGWEASVPVLTGQVDYAPAPTNVPACVLLPANERRRAPKTVKLALAVGAEACAGAVRDPAELPAVFTSSGGDGETINDLLNTLASSQRELSPTKFHNSVHNAPAGYWSIATGAKTASTTLCAHDDSFGAGLLEAMAQMATTGQTVALIAYDVPYPDPLYAARPVSTVFGMALVLSPTPSATAFARLELTLRPGVDTPSPAVPALETLRQTTPAARSLPLLAALAGGMGADVTLDYLSDMTLKLNITPRPPAGWPGPLA